MPRRTSLLAFLLSLLLSAASFGAQPKILFDEGHGQRFLVGRAGQLDLSELAVVLSKGGFDVVTTTAPLTAERLASVRALVISGPFAPLTVDEIGAVLDFVANGGALVTMLHIPMPLSDLLHRLGVSHSNGVVREREGVIGGEPLNFRVTRLGAHPLTNGLLEFSIYGSWALRSENERSKSIAQSGPGSWVDLDRDQQLGPGDAVQSFGLVVAGRYGQGRFVVFGDDAMFQNRFLSGTNVDLTRNLASWLAEARLLAATDGRTDTLSGAAE